MQSGLINKPDLAVRLEQLLERSGRNSRQFALSLGVDVSYFNKALKGNGLALKHLNKIVDTYKVSRDMAAAIVAIFNLTSSLPSQ